MRSVVIRLGLLLLGVVPASAQMLPPIGKTDGALTDDAEMHVRAEVQERVAKGHYRFHGFVDVVAGDLRVQANEVDLFEEEGPDGKLHRRAEATGEVVFFQGDQRLSGTSGTLDLDTGKGRILHARGFLDPGVFVEADEIERISAKVYRVKGGTFTSCYQPHPRWSFTARSAKVKLGSHLLATLVDFHVMDAPTPIFLPVFYYPLHEDQRSTGLLFPQVSTSSIRGFGVSSGFFWAMGRSYDQTLTVERYSKEGIGLGHEFRYQLANPSQGTFFTRGLRQKEGGNWDYTLQWDAAQALPGKFTAKLSVFQNSNTIFGARLQDRIDLALSRNESARMSVSRNFSFGDLLLQARRDTSVPAGSTPTETQYEHLPSLRLSRAALGVAHTKIGIGYDLAADQLGIGDGKTVNRFGRLDGSVRVQRPFATSFLNITPLVSTHYRQWGAQQSSTGFVRERLDQSYFEGSVGIEGPTFSRVFLNEGGFYSDKLKHEIGPTATFSYLSAIENFDQIVKVDERDRFPSAGSGSINYGLVQRLSAKRPGYGGKPVAITLLSWTLTQSYYADVRASRSDPRFDSSTFTDVPAAIATPTPVPRHHSPIRSRIRFAPSGQWTADSLAEYDIYAHGFRSLSVSTRLSLDRLSFDGSWSRSQTFNEAGQATVVTSLLEGGGQFQLVPNKLAVSGEAHFDLRSVATIRLPNAKASLRYDVQCCGFIVDYHYLKYSDELKDSGFSFRIQLANIGSATGLNRQDAFGSPGVRYGGRQ
jgi:LptD protein